MRPARRASIGAAALAAVAVGCGARGDRPGTALFPDMIRSLPYDPYDPSPSDPARGVALAPPDGTVPMGAQPFPYGPGDAEAERAGRELQNPFAAAPETLARGRAVYERVCFVCHGVAGEGDGPIIGRFPNPASLVADKAKGLPDGRIFHIISRGQGIMPSYAVQVLPEDRWRVILYVRELQRVRGAGGAPAAAGGGRR